MRAANLEQVLAVLRQHRDELRQLGVLKLGVFGSVARGEQRTDSDLDFLVELDRKTFDRYMDLKLFLEDLFQTEVDLVPSDRLKPELKERVLAELVDAA